MASAKPAEPLLASALIDDDELSFLFDDVIGGKSVPAKEGALETGSKSVDEALGGGLERGRNVGVWSEVGGGGAEICLSLMSASLLSNSRCTAAVVDTTGNFDVLRLYSFLLGRFQDNAESLKTFWEDEGMKGLSIEEVAAKVLDRVKIMRAFDLVGVMEAVGEVRDELEERTPQENPVTGKKSCERRPPKSNPDEATHGDLPPEDPPKEQAAAEPKELPQRTFVADSDDEDELLFDDEPAASTSITLPPTNPPPLAEEDEILFVDGADERTRASSPPWDSPLRSRSPANPQSNTETVSSKPTFILIDNLVHVVSPLLKKDYAQAQALTSSFLLTLSHLTRNHNLHTLVLNPTAAPRPPSTKLNSNQDDRHQPRPPPSIFLSNGNVPALMGILTPFLDLSLLVERMPWGKNEAKAVYADGEAVKRVGSGVKMVGVVEVMSDRWDGRGGGWGMFVHSENGVRDV